MKEKVKAVLREALQYKIRGNGYFTEGPSFNEDDEEDDPHRVRWTVDGEYEADELADFITTRLGL